ncbi:hypothetical protein KEM56_007126 [Ascosphaera pollenicola]|nr:hypothetical protein KEM56_007126 [Ascosphaera pollenicola]
MAPKQKVQKMALGDFLQDQDFGSWADEMDELPMAPSAEPPRMYDGQRRAFGTSSFEGGYAPREALPLPTVPPYTAHIGNLSFESTSNDVESFFAECGTTSVRVVDDKLTGSSKGFGYVEFHDVEGLKKALTLSGTSLQGRNIRVSVAEPRTSKSLHLPSSSSSRYPRNNAPFSGRFDTGNDHGARGFEKGISREPGSLSPRLPNDQPCTIPIPISRSEFGLKLTILAKSTAKDREPVREFDWTRKGPLPDAPRDNVRDSGPRRRFEPLDPAMGAGAGPSAREFSWERKGPLRPASPPPGGFREGGRPRNTEGPGFRRQSPAASAAMWGEARSRETSRPAAPPPQPSAADMDNKWRARMMPDASAPETSSGPTLATRPKLNLQKRSVAASETAVPASASSTEPKSNPFGNAKPIDTAAREREIEEKRLAALQAKKEADEKAKEEKEKAKAAAAEAAAAKKEAEEAAAAAADAAKEEEVQNKVDENAEAEKKDEAITEAKPADESKEDAAPVAASAPTAAADAATAATPAETPSKPVEEAKTETTITQNQQQPPKAAAENWRSAPRAGGDSHRGGRGGRGGRGAHRGDRGDRHHGGRRHDGEHREPREPREPRAEAPPAQPVVDEEGWSTVGPAKKGNRRSRWGQQQQ